MIKHCLGNSQLNSTLKESHFPQNLLSNNCKRLLRTTKMTIVKENNLLMISDFIRRREKHANGET